MASTLTEYLDSQEELVREAAEALPHEFSRCTYATGSLRQAVYLCTTCPESRGLCSACSIACHTDHEQIELFPKRNFRCDCPTTAISHPCKLHPRLEDINTGNQYGQNFQGLFCRCRRTYDAHKERETMIQCLACEDWFHESCCNLRERPPPKGSTPEPTTHQDSTDADTINDAASEASSTGLPPSLISADDYESFVCGSCVSQNPTLKRFAGTCGILMVVRDSLTHPWRRLESRLDHPEGDDEVRVHVSDSPVRSGVKRPLELATVEPAAKRPRSSLDAESSGPTHPTCLAPPPSLVAQRILSDMSMTADDSTGLGTGDIFLTEGFRGRWCRCCSCLPALETNPYLLEDEETYEPPTDPDSTLSLEELGMRALSRIPRDKAIEGIHAFNEMKDDLVKFLRPFAQDGKIVNESDVKTFFATLSESSQKGSGN